MIWTATKPRRSEFAKITSAKESPPRIVSISVTEDDTEQQKSAKFDGIIRKYELKTAEDLLRVWFPHEVLTVQPASSARIHRTTKLVPEFVPRTGTQRVQGDATRLGETFHRLGSG